MISPLLLVSLASFAVASNPAPQAPPDAGAAPPRLLIYPGDLILVEEVESVDLPVGRTSVRIDFVRGNADVTSLEVVPLDHPAEVRIVALERRNELPNTTFVELESTAAVTERLRIGYAAHGLATGVRYQVVLDAANQRLDLVQEMDVNNYSGETFELAAVQSVFGSVKTVSSGAVLQGRAPDPAPGGPPGIPVPQLRQDLADNTVISFGEPVALPTGVVIGRTTLVKTAVPLVIDYRFDAHAAGGRVTRRLKVANSEGQGLGGVTLQPGGLRLDERIGEHRERFLLAGAIGHLPPGKELELDAGLADDLFVERELMDLARTDLVFGEYNRALISYAVEESYRLKVRNHSGEVRSLLVTEHVAGTSTFEVVDSSVPATKKDQSTVEFRIEVPAGGAAELTYRVRKTDVKA